MGKLEISQEEKNRRGEIMRAGMAARRAGIIPPPKAESRKAEKPKKEKKEPITSEDIPVQDPSDSTPTPDLPSSPSTMPSLGVDEEQKKEEFAHALKLNGVEPKSYRQACAEALKRAWKKQKDYGVWEKDGIYTISPIDLFPGRTPDYYARPE